MLEAKAPNFMVVLAAKRLGPFTASTRMPRGSCMSGPYTAVVANPRMSVLTLSWLSARPVRYTTGAVLEAGTAMVLAESWVTAWSLIFP